MTNRLHVVLCVQTRIKNIKIKMRVYKKQTFQLGGYSGLYIFQDLGLKLNQTIITIFFNKTLKNKMVKKKQDWIQTHNTRLDETYDPVVTCKPNIKTRRILSLLNTKKENVVIPNVFGFSLN